MRVHVLQHVPFEGLGSIQSWLDARNAVVTWTRFYDEPSLPNEANIDFLIVLGGPMSVNDEAMLPWLVAEKRFVADMVRSGKPVLGICLGAQLIASAFGASVTPNQQKEIGWFDIDATSQSSDQSPDTFRFPAKTKVFHWHGETFGLPPGAWRLARSVGCDNQAFQLGARAIGLQFHLEMTTASAEAIISHCRNELVAGEFVQAEFSMRAVSSEAYASINALMARVLDYLNR